MTLFKYVTSERLDVIKNLEIRFTQPDSLNDPFELQPNIESLIAEAEILANLPESPPDLRPMITQAYEMLPPQLQTIPLEFAVQYIEEVMSTDDGRRATAEGIGLFLNAMREGAAPVRNAIHSALNENVGILSLSEIADNDIMWAHYADSHRGLVLCFDEGHSFFNQRRSENDEFCFVRKVHYRDGPPVSLATIDGDAILITKGTQWSYERELRMLLPLNRATRSLSVRGDTIHLFAFPPAALRGIILGAHATTETQTFLTSLLTERADLSHLKLVRATIDLNTRSVSVAWPLK